MKKRKKETLRLISSLKELEEGRFYRTKEILAILKNLGLNHSIFTLRDYEVWKCLDYKCGFRHSEKVNVCVKCGGRVRPPLVFSPRTFGLRQKGWGHRRYNAKEIKEIIKVFAERGRY